VVQDHPHGTLTLILGVSLGHNRYPSQKGSGINPVRFKVEGLALDPVNQL
jgi:hypothetical protein